MSSSVSVSAAPPSPESIIPSPGLGFTKSADEKQNIQVSKGRLIYEYDPTCVITLEDPCFRVSPTQCRADMRTAYRKFVVQLSER